MDCQKLVLQVQAERASSMVLEKPITVIGRGVDCDHRLEARGVSRRHARIRWSEQSEWTLEDLASTNGTFLNGKRVVRPETIRAGDVISLGEVRLRVQDPVEAPALSVVFNAVELRDKWAGDHMADSEAALPP